MNHSYEVCEACGQVSTLKTMHLMADILICHICFVDMGVAYDEMDYDRLRKKGRIA